MKHLLGHTAGQDHLSHGSRHSEELGLHQGYVRLSTVGCISCSTYSSA